VATRWQRGGRLVATSLPPRCLLQAPLYASSMPPGKRSTPWLRHEPHSPCGEIPCLSTGLCVNRSPPCRFPVSPRFQVTRKNPPCWWAGEGPVHDQPPSSPPSIPYPLPLDVYPVGDSNTGYLLYKGDSYLFERRGGFALTQRNHWGNTVLKRKAL